MAVGSSVLASRLLSMLADVKNGPFAHAPSGHFQANAAWLTLAPLAHNLTRAAGTLASAFHAKATTDTIRDHLINMPARLARSARRLTLHLPERWPCGTTSPSSRTAPNHPKRSLRNQAGGSGLSECGPDAPVVGSDGSLRPLGDVPPQMPGVSDLHCRVAAKPHGQRRGVPAG
jgi:hypothetical protein